MNGQDFIKLCTKDISGNISKVDKEELLKWLSQSSDNKLEYETLKNIWAKTSTEEISELPDIDEEWYKLNEQINFNKSKNHKYSIFGKLEEYISINLSSLLKPVGAAAIVIVLLIVGLNLVENDGPEHKQIVVTTANAMTKTVLLPDGSEVVLNNSSKINYSVPFGEDVREVELEGEAFFSVIKNKTPFVIKTGNAQVKVLGTQFNVWSREEETKVVVRNGTVELSPSKLNNNGVLLTQNQASKIIGDKEPIQPYQVNSDFLLGWLDGNLVFDQTSIPVVADELERHYNISVEIADDDVKDLTLTGEFSNDKPDSIFNMICLALNLDYSKEGEHFILKNK